MSNILNNMDGLLSIFGYAFMQRALISGIVLGGLLSYLGVFVVLKRMSFFGEGIAHASLSGIALGLMLGVSPLWTAIAASLVFAVAIYFLEERGLSGDSAIGVVFSFGMALGALFMGFTRGYRPELMSFLFGNILSVKYGEILIIVPVAVLILAFLIVFRRNLVLMSLDEDLAKTSGVPVKWLKPALYAATAVSVVLGIKVLGIMLVSSAMIIPVSAARFVSSSFRSVSLISFIFAELIMVSGLVVSYVFDLPTGAAIVIIGSVVLFASAVYRALSGKF